MQTNEMSLYCLALTRSVKKGVQDAARAAIKPGRHRVDFMAHITGSLFVGKDSVRTTYPAIDYMKALAALCTALVKSGTVPQKAIDDILRDCLYRAAEGEVTDDMLGAITLAAKEVGQRFQPKQMPCKGRVTPSLSVDFA